VPSAKIENTTPFTTYSMTVQARNAIGYGPESPPVEAQFNYNKASGGTPQTGNTDPLYPGADIYEDYLGMGEKWAVHTFITSTADKTFIVESDVHPFRVLCVAGGGGGGYDAGGGGGGGGVIAKDQHDIGVGSYPVQIGAGGGNNNNGGNSVLADLTAVGGGRGGTWHCQSGNGGGSGGGASGSNGSCGAQGGKGTAGQGHDGCGFKGVYSGWGGGGAGGPATNRNGGPALPSDISGSTVHYGSGGYGQGGNWPSPKAAYGCGGYGGGYGSTPPNPAGSSGTAGIVIVAYRIG